MDYLIIIEETSTGYSAYAPDLPGCVATGASIIDVQRAMRETIEFHIEGLKLEGMPVPPPKVKAAFFSIGKAGNVYGEKPVEAVYDIKAFSKKVGITPSTARVYAHRYKIGKKYGRGWVFSDTDFEVLAKRYAKASLKKD
jgi:predicted RNase H-like HicB family nuclease